MVSYKEKGLLSPDFTGLNWSRTSAKGYVITFLTLDLTFRQLSAQEGLYDGKEGIQSCNFMYQAIKYYHPTPDINLSLQPFH